MAKKKKTSKRGPGRPGVDRNQLRRERLEARRQAKAEALAAQRRAEQRRRLINRAVALVIGVGLFWFFFLRPTQRVETIAGNEVLYFSDSAGTPSHVDGTVSYESTPPVSGQHSPAPLSCGKYSTQPPNESMVHALEHGAVALFYDPAEVDEEGIRVLEGFVDEHADEPDADVLSGPYPGMPSPIAIASWGEMMRLDSVDETAIREYIAEFRGNGPEDLECPAEVDDPFEPEPTPTPEPSPSPDESPGGQDGKKGNGGGKGDEKNGGGGGQNG